MRAIAPIAILLLAACAGSPETPAGRFPPSASPAAAPPAVVPQAEHDKAQARHAHGPTANKGIESIKPIGSVPLEDEIPGAGNRVLRVRELVIAPGGVVAVHQHDGRPGMAYILEGEMTEFRGEQPAPEIKRAGEAAFEQTGVTHWWENRGKTRARALVVDIVPAQ